MAKIHVLAGSGSNSYRVVVHGSAPAGSNQSQPPILYSDCIKAAAPGGTPTSSMPVGNSPGFITQAEANQIGTGAVIEGQFQWDDDPTWTNTERAADLDLRANQMIAELQANYVAMFKFFGFTRS